MKELKQLTQNQVSPADAANVSGGEGDCTATVTVGTDGISIGTTDGTVGGALIGTYEGIIEATSYALERVINAVSN